MSLAGLPEIQLSCGPPLGERLPVSQHRLVRSTRSCVCYGIIRDCSHILKKRCYVFLATDCILVICSQCSERAGFYGEAGRDGQEARCRLRAVGHALFYGSEQQLRTRNCGRGRRFRLELGRSSRWRGWATHRGARTHRINQRRVLDETRVLQLRLKGISGPSCRGCSIAASDNDPRDQLYISKSIGHHP